MQELSHHVFIETAYPGVTLGAINWPHGLILIDSPIRAEDNRSWKSALLNLGGGVDRLLVNLDAHFDRTLGSRAMDCTVVGHEKMAQVFRNRPISFKTQATETGAEWEQYNGLGSIRWAPPEITFTEQMLLHWDEKPLILESHPGPFLGAIWAILPGCDTIFVGDAVVKDQPPFLANADLPAWQETLQHLLLPEYQNYLLVSGRGGLVTHAEVRSQLAFLQKAYQKLEALKGKSAPVEEVEILARTFLKDFDIPAGRELQYQQRLSHGMRQYYTRHYLPGFGDNLEE